MPGTSASESYTFSIQAENEIMLTLHDFTSPYVCMTISLMQPPFTTGQVLWYGTAKCAKKSGRSDISGMRTEWTV